MKKLILLFVLVGFSLISAQEHSKIAGKPGAFTRMGFGARGMGMGNAMLAVTEGALVAYYNPAAAVFQENNSFHTSYSVLSLDRSLNFVNFSKKFAVGKRKSTIGLSVGLINAGVDNIDQRDNQGIITDNLSTSENQFFMAFGIQFSEKLALGVNFKYYYYDLYEDISSTGFGFDVGLIYSFNENIKLGFSFVDLNTRYEWDTKEVYEENGLNYKEKFPLLKKAGIAVKFPEEKLLLTAEWEGSNYGTNYVRMGAEYNVYDRLFLRTGFDKWNLSETESNANPTFGFSYFKILRGIDFGVNYAFVIEHYSDYDQHIVGLTVGF